MKGCLLCLAMMLLGLMNNVLATPANGAQAIGFANWHENDVRELAALYVRLGGELEMSFLPNEFNASNPYGNSTRFVQAALPQLKGRLTVTAYLYFHDYSYQEKFDWSAFRSGSKSAFREKYLRRVAEFNAWAGNIRAWAIQQRVDRKLNIILCPFLEDDCPNSQAYSGLLSAITRQQSADRIRTLMRRSCLDNNLFRVPGMSLELHGDFQRVVRYLRSGDAYSNDGLVVSVNQFLESQRQARQRGINVLYWAGVYNGLDEYDRSAAPAQRRRLTPISGKGGEGERNALVQILRNR